MGGEMTQRLAAASAGGVSTTTFAFGCAPVSSASVHLAVPRSDCWLMTPAAGFFPHTLLLLVVAVRWCNFVAQHSERGTNYSQADVTRLRAMSTMQTAALRCRLEQAQAVAKSLREHADVRITHTHTYCVDIVWFWCSR